MKVYKNIILFSFTFFLFFIISYCFSGPQYAAGNPVSKTLKQKSNYVPIHIRGNRIVYNKNKGTYTITGNVVITRKNFKLTADKVVYFYKTGLGVATGNVVVYSRNALTKAKRLKVYVTTRLGTIYNSHIHYLGKSIYVYGKKIRHEGKGFYQVERGYITSCKRKPPSWELYSNFSDIYVGEYAYMYNSLFYIHGVPVFYLPVMIVPIKTKKSSGLLIPSAGYSSLLGFQVGDGYYFDLGDSQDLTYYLNYYSFLGIGNSLKYRYSLNTYSHGSIYGFYMHEKMDSKSLSLSPDSTRYLLFSHNIDFFGNLSLKTNINVPSDNSFYYDFSTSVYQMTKNRLSSNFSATDDFDGFSARINFLRLDNLFFPNYTTVDEYPSLTFSGSTKLVSFLDNPLYLDLNSSFDIFRSPAYLNDNRLDVFPDFYMPLNLLNGIHITPSAGFRYTGYYDISNGITGGAEGNKNREIYYGKISANATFYKDFPSSSKNDKGYLAFITPFVNYNIIRPVNQSGLPLIDQTDFIPEESAFKYGLKFNLEGYEDDSINNLLRISAYQYHSISGNFINPINYFNYDNVNSDIIIRAKVHPVSSLYFFGSGSYDDYNYIFHNYNVGSELIDSRGDSFSLGYTEINDIQGYLTALNMFNSTNINLFPQSTSPITTLNTLSFASISANLRIIDGFSINTTENIDLTTHQDISNSIGALFQTGCIGFILNYMNLPYFHQWAFSFGIILKGLGTYGFGNLLSQGPTNAGIPMPAMPSQVSY